MKLSSIYDYIKRPIVTEKSHRLEQLSKKKYTFEVHLYSNKASVSEAVSKAFNVQVDSVNILNTSGKQKRYRGIMGKRPEVKKAVVTLKIGHSINMSNERLSL